MTQFTIRLTLKEAELLHHTALNPDDWIRNLVEWRVRLVEDNLVPTIVQQLKDGGATHMPKDKASIIMAGNLPPKDPNWTPIDRDLPDQECETFTFELSDDEIKVLEWEYENPHQHIHDWVVERAQIAIKEKADYITKELLADPTWTKPIPLDPLELLELVELKTVKEHMELTSKVTAEMVLRSTQDPTWIPEHVPFHTYYHHADPSLGTDTP